MSGKTPSSRTTPPPATGGSGPVPLGGAGSSSRARANVSEDQPTIISRRAPLPADPPVSESARRILQGRIEPGDRLEHFELIEYIGGGGMGRVYRAIDTRLARPVALKVLSPEQAADPETLARFQNEAQSAARLDHENIARVFHVGEDCGLQYIVFEFIEGENVRNLVEHDGPLPLAEAISYTLQAADALAHAASRNVVHRDIKPSNLIITPEGRVKLIDMGLARLRQLDPAAADLTASGVTLGTFDYISPEQARDPRNADVRSDVYSLGCTLLYMLTGRPPFPEGTVLQKLLQHQGDQPPDLRELRPDLPESLARILRKMMAKEPRSRYQHPRELIDELLALAARTGLRPIRPGRKTWAVVQEPVASFLHRNLPWIAPVVLLVAAVIVLDRFWSSQGNGKAQLPPIVIEPAGQAGGPAQPGGTLPASSSDSQSPAAVVPVVGTEPVGRPSGPTSPAAGTPGGQQPSPGSQSPVEAAGTGDGGSTAGTPPPGSDGNSTSPSPAADRGSAPPSSPAPTGPPDRAALAFEPARGGMSMAGEDAPALGLGPYSAGLAVGLTAAGMHADSAAGGNGPTPRRSGLLVVDGADEGEREFSSLAAALGSAASGDVIELRFDGPRQEPPIRLANARVTIRAGAGFRPVLVFRTDDLDPVPLARSMFVLAGGQISLINVCLQLDVPRDAPAGSWSLFEVREGQVVRLEKCVLTIANASGELGAYHSNVAFFRAGPSDVADLAFDIASGMGMGDLPCGLDLLDCVVRGEAAVLRVEQSQPVDFSWTNGLAATAEPLLVASGAGRPPLPGDRIDVSLRHLTAIVPGGLCRIADDPLDPHQLPVSIRCTDSIVMTVPGKPLVVQEGIEEAEQLREAFAWTGDRNFYQRCDVFWSIRSIGSQDEPEPMRFADWCRHWTTLGQKGTVGENLPSLDEVVWSRLPAPDRPLHAHAPADYALDRTLAANPAVAAASDGRDAGMETGSMPDVAPQADTAPAAGSTTPHAEPASATPSVIPRTETPPAAPAATAPKPAAAVPVPAG